MKNDNRIKNIKDIRNNMIFSFKDVIQAIRFLDYMRSLKLDYKIHTDIIDITDAYYDDARMFTGEKHKIITHNFNTYEEIKLEFDVDSNLFLSGQYTNYEKI